MATGGLPAGIAVLAMIGDSHAALYGQGGFAPGLVKATLGTGSSLMTPMGGPIASTHGLSTTLAWHDGGRATFAMEGNIVHTGAAVQWASRLVAGESLDALTEQAAQLPDNGGVYFVPALSGLGAPHWKADARGLICGLTEATSGAHILRAALESIVVPGAVGDYAGFVLGGQAELEQLGRAFLIAIGVVQGQGGDGQLRLTAHLLDKVLLQRPNDQLHAVGLGLAVETHPASIWVLS